MAKFLFEAKYTAEGLKGVRKDTAVRRRAMVSKVAEALGGKLDLMLFGFGERDVIGVLDLPDTVSAASATLAASLSGLIHSRTTALLTAEEMDQAFAKKLPFASPGKA
jgi:uncharacterized protein with GYD domain